MIQNINNSSGPFNDHILFRLSVFEMSCLTYMQKAYNPIYTYMFTDSKMLKFIFWIENMYNKVFLVQFNKKI